MLQTSWSKKEERKEKVGKFSEQFSKISRRIFWIFTITILLAIAAGGFYFYQYFTSRDVFVSLKAPDRVFAGAPFNINVEVLNDSDKSIKDIAFSMVLPEGTAFLGEEIDKRFYQQNFGDLEKSASFQEKIPLIIFGNEQSVKKFELIVSYFPPSLGPKVRFEIIKTVEVAAREPAVKFDLIAPQKVLNNEDFEIEINYQNISGIDLSNLELKLEYPQFFTFINSDPKPSTGDNFWRIGSLPKNEQAKIIVISGKAVGPEQSFFEIKSALKAEFSGRQYLVAKKNTSINIAPSPLFLNIVADNNNGPSFLGADLKYKIVYRNNSNVGLNDAVIKAKLNGELFDIKELKTSGFFDSRNNTVIWNAANTPDLRLIAPESEGMVEFEIKVKESYPIKRVSDRNFILKVEAEISSPTIPYYVVSDKTIGLAKSEIKIAGAIDLDAEAVFLKGYFPPRVNKPTNFTVKWTIKNYSTDVSNIEILSFLQSGVRFVGPAKSNVNSVPVYNERTQEIVWLIEKIPATKGVIGNPVEASFQIEAVPNITQLDNLMPLMNQTNLKAFDEFVKIELKDSVRELLTSQLVTQ